MQSATCRSDTFPESRDEGAWKSLAGELTRDAVRVHVRCIAKSSETARYQERAIARVLVFMA